LPTRAITRTPSASSSAAVLSIGSPILKRNHLVAEGLTVIQDNYRISFDITVFNHLSTWGSIFHFTNQINGNCCKFGWRVPALYFYPNSARFYWIAGTPRNGDELVVAKDSNLDLNREYHVDLKVVNGVAYLFIDGILANRNGQGQKLTGVGPTQTNVYLYMSDGFYGPAPNAAVKNFEMFEDDTVWIVKQDSPILSHNNLVPAGLNNVIQDNYRISFDITVFGTVTYWGSIFHFTNRGSCCSFGDRVPALFFYRNSTRFYWIAGNPRGTNELVLEHKDSGLDLNREYHVDLKVVNGVAYMFIDGNLVNRNGAGQRLSSVGSTQTNVKLYFSDNDHTVPNATIKNFGMFEDATVW